MKKPLVLLLALLLTVGLFAGCAMGSDTPSSTPTPPSTTPTSGNEAPSSDTPEDISSLPLSDTMVTFSAWWPLTGAVLSHVSDLNDVKCMIELERRTNIHIDAEQPSATGLMESFSLMIASNDLPDLIWDIAFQGGPEKAVDDGYYLKLNDYLDEFLPNYSAVRNSDPQIAKDTVTDKGYITAIYGISGHLDAIYDILGTTKPAGGVSFVPPWAGLQVRKDWLDDLGLEVPITYSDWEVMLTEFKNEKNAVHPMLLGNTGNFQFSELSAGFGVNMEFFQKDGKVHYSPLEEGYKNYLTLVADWYSKGLIHQDFMGETDLRATAKKFGFTGETGVIWDNPDYAGNSGVVIGLSSDENLFYQAVVSPKVNASDDRVQFRCYPGKVGQGFSVSTACGNPELLLKWIDYMYSDEGSLLISFGPEGESLEFVDGKPQYTDLVVNNPDVLFTTNRYIYSLNSGPYLQHTYRFVRYTTGDAYHQQGMNTVTAQNIWLESGVDYMMPDRRTMTSDEGSEYSALYNDIKSLVDENTLKIIMGQVSVDEWENVVSQIRSMNVDKVITIQQNALDRYNAR